MSRSASSDRAGSASDSGVSLSVFPTEIGWMGIAGRDNRVQSVLVGHPSAASVRKAVRTSTGANGEHQTASTEADWFPKLREALQDYARGQRVSFAEFDLLLPAQTPFRDKVLAATRQ